MRAPTSSRNFHKHTSRNPLQRWLLARFHGELVNLLRSALAGERSQRLLELGCGEGFVLQAIQARCPELALVALDRQPEALAWARQLASATLFLADLRALPFLVDSFPLVLCVEVLEHLDDPHDALAEMRRVADPWVLLSVPHQPWFSLANALRGRNWRSLGDDPEHRHRWTEGAFLRLLEPWLTVEVVVSSFPWLLALGRARS